MPRVRCALQHELGERRDIARLQTHSGRVARLDAALESRSHAHRDRLAFEWSGLGHMTGPLDPPGFAPTGAAVAMRGVDIHTFRGDLVAHVVTITDVAAVALQIGAMPPAGSLGEKMGVQVQRLMARRLRRKS